MRTRTASEIGRIGRIEPGRLTRPLSGRTPHPDTEIKSPTEVNQAEEKQDKQDGRRAEFDCRLAALMPGAAHCGYTPLKALMASSAAGPRRMIHNVGKMHPIIGRSIFKEAFAPRSWATSSRFSRISSD